jgi:hypothetical protein
LMGIDLRCQPLIWSLYDPVTPKSMFKNLERLKMVCSLYLFDAVR